MLDSIYHRTLKYLKSYFGCENINILPTFMLSYNGFHYIMLLNLKTTCGLSNLMHGVI